MKPIFTDPDDIEFTTDMARAAVDRYYNIGPEREAELAALIKQREDGTYYVPYCSVSYGADFHDQANYKEFSEKYKWLAYCALDASQMNYKASRGEGKNFQDFLADIPDDEWESFLEDIKTVKNDPVGFSGDRVWELEQAETDRYWKEDGHRDLVNEICKRLKNSFQQFVVRKLTSDETWKWIADMEMYPEAQGEGTVWMDEEKAAKEFDFDEYYAGVDLHQYDAAWLNEKRRSWSVEHRDTFEHALTFATKGDPRKCEVMAGLDDSALFHLLVKVVGDDLEDGEPGWYLNTPFYGSEEDKGRWFVSIGEPSEKGWYKRDRVELGLAKAAQKAAAYLDNREFHVPKEHPEFKFEAKESQHDPYDDMDLEQARAWIAMGGYDSADTVYKDHTLRIIIPRTLDTLRKYAPLVAGTHTRLDEVRLGYGEIFICIPASHPEADPATQRFGYGPFVVLENSEVGLSTTGGGASLEQRLKDADYGPSLRKGLMYFFRRMARRTRENKYQKDGYQRAFPVLLQLGGFKSVARSLHKHVPGEDSAADWKIGWAALKAGHLETAAEYLDYPQDLLRKDGIILVYNDWPDLAIYFNREHKGTARKIFNGDMDWIGDWAWEAKFDLNRLLSDLKPQHYAIIRKVLINREVEGEDDQPHYLTRKEIDEMSDVDIDTLIKDAESFEDIREQMQRAARRGLQYALEGAWWKTAEKAIEELLGKAAFIKYHGKDKLSVFLTLSKVAECVDNYESDNGNSYGEGVSSLADWAGVAGLPDDVNASYDDDANTLDEALSEELSELEPGELPVDPNQPELLHVPSHSKKVYVPIFSEYYPNGATVGMREDEYVRMKEQEPWRLDAKLWKQHAKKHGIKPKSPVQPVGEAKQTYRVKVGQTYWFEYHCLEADHSADAELWYHSHQQVKVLRTEARGGGKDENERAYNGHPAAFKIRFADGFEHTGMEDELLDSREEFNRPDPPLPPAQRPDKGKKRIGESDPDAVDPQQYVSQLPGKYLVRVKAGGTWAYHCFGQLRFVRPNVATVFDDEAAQHYADKYRKAHPDADVEIVSAPELVPNPLPVITAQESLQEAEAYKRGVAMVELPEAQADFLIEWGQLNIPDNLLHQPPDDDSMGREKEMHVTAKYGFTTDVLHQLHEIGESTPAFPVYIGSISLFEQADYDVVKLDVESPWLRKLNARLSQLPNDDSHPDYKPHVTLAYVKKGTCSHLVGQDPFKGEGSPGAEFTAYSMSYKGPTEDAENDPNRVEDHILFAKEKRAPEQPELEAPVVAEAVDPDEVGLQRYVDDLPQRTEQIFRDAGFRETLASDKRFQTDVYRVGGKKRFAAISRVEVFGEPIWKLRVYQAGGGQYKVVTSLMAHADGIVRALEQEGLRVKPVAESVDPDDINFDQYIDSMPTYYELTIEFPIAGIGKLYVDTAGGFHSMPQRLVYNEAMVLKDSVAKEYPMGTFTLQPSKDQSQMYWMGVRWPEDFEFDDRGVRHPKSTVKLPMAEAQDPDVAGRYVDDLSKRFAVYIDRDPHRVYADEQGHLVDDPVFMPMQKAVRLMRMATKAGNTPVRLQQEQKEPFDGLPFPSDPTQLSRFLKHSTKRAERVIL